MSEIIQEEKIQDSEIPETTAENQSSHSEQQEGAPVSNEEAASNAPIVATASTGETSEHEKRLSEAPAVATVEPEVKQERNPLIPDILGDLPDDSLEVEFDMHITCEFGNILTPTQVKSIPKLRWKTAEDVMHLVGMFDVDAPTKKNPKLSLYQHWVVGNVPGTHVSKGTVLTEYLSAAPPKRSGQHRYVFLIYQQPEKKPELIMYTETKINKKTGMSRERFSIDKMVDKYGLIGPIAGNFFIAEWDIYVSQIEKSLGVKVSTIV